MKFRQWIAAVSLVMLVGCVVVPMSRTYYEPNSADGTPIRSASCGWNATALDGLKREIDGTAISIFPKYEKGVPLRIVVLIGRPTRSTELAPEQMELRATDAKTGVRSVTTDTKAAGPYFYRSISYSFPPEFDADEFEVTFLTGFIKIDGREIDVSPFRFKRTTKTDVYFGSINC